MSSVLQYRSAGETRSLFCIYQPNQVGPSSDPRDRKHSIEVSLHGNPVHGRVVWVAAIFELRMDPSVTFNGFPVRLSKV